jgi:hypothetical protein
MKMPIKHIVAWLQHLFNGRKAISLGLYGSPNAGKTTLANRISIDWLGEPVGIVSEIPHETRVVQKKERVHMKLNGKSLSMNLLDMPGIATKVDYREFLPYGLSVKEAQQRAKEATKGIIEAIKWLENVDAALVVMDSTEDPYTQVNITILGNLEAKNIPVIIIANKMDLAGSKPDRIKEAFPHYPMVEMSALKGTNIDHLYSEITRQIT